VAVETTITGRCGCGQVRYAAQSKPRTAIICQCRDCQFGTGTGHSCLLMMSVDMVSLSGPLTIYHSTADSGRTVERQFCSICGSPIAYRSAAFANAIFLTAGSLDDPSIFEPSMVVYAASAPPWDAVDPQLKKFEHMASRPG
jgi:hypothetical protein